MSQKEKQKIVQIPENKLVDLIDNIVKEAVAEKKKQWIAEHKKNSNTNILENRIAKLENLLSKAVITKKK